MVFHLVKTPGKNENTFPVVKSIPFKTNRRKNIIIIITMNDIHSEPQMEVADGQKQTLANPHQFAVHPSHVVSPQHELVVNRGAPTHVAVMNKRLVCKK